MKQKQKKAAKAAIGCLVLLLLYGCASHVSGFYGGEADEKNLEADGTAGADFSWTEGRSEGMPDAADESAVRSGNVSGTTDGTALDERSGASGPGDRAVSGEAADASSGMIAVYVCGAVKKPGVYELAAGSRVYEAVAMAGGMTKEAAERSVNQAETLSDGQMIVILTADEEAKGYAEKAGDEKAENGDGLVNINTADVEELKSLPGIGDAKAAAILAYRKEHGAFSAVSDIKNVSGIGDSMFAKLEGLIKVDER